MADVNAYMKANRLRLINPQKTQLIWLGSRRQLEKLNMVDSELVSASLSPLSAVRNLGVTIDDGHLRRLHSVQNAAARLVTGTRRCEGTCCSLPNNSTPVLGLSIRPRFYGSQGQTHYKVYPP